MIKATAPIRARAEDYHQTEEGAKIRRGQKREPVSRQLLVQPNITLCADLTTNTVRNMTTLFTSLLFHFSTAADLSETRNVAKGHQRS